MSFFRACVEAMSAYVPGEQPAEGARVTKLNTNENPYPPSPRVTRAILGELGEGAERLRLYSDPGALALRQAASRQTGVCVERILAGNGSDELLALLLRAMADPGDRVAYPFPSYVLYETLIAAQGARAEVHDFGREFALPKSLFGTDARIVFVTSPNSPSGTQYDPAELERLARSLARGILVIDEAYAGFASRDALALVGRLDNVVVTRTLSKSHSLAGLRVGLLYAPEPIVEGLSKVKDSYNLDRLAIAAGAAALDDSKWMETNVQRIRRTRERLTERLAELGFEVLPSEANFVFARLGSSDEARALYLALKDQGILVRYFDRPALGDGLRITVGTDEEIDQLLEAVEDGLSR